MDSALQAYALQRIISKLGFDCELIDYIINEKKGLCVFIAHE